MSNIIKQQWQQMINNGTMPLFEIQISKDDYLLVDLELSDNGIRFAFDTSPLPPYNVLPVSFDGEIERLGEGVYLLPFDSACSDGLDSLLEMIYENIIEGYLIPNNLFYSEEN
jgi:hypothetical protein